MLEIVSSGNFDTNEYETALKLEKLVKEEIPNLEKEKDLLIYLIPSVYLYGQQTRDIDLLIFYADFREKNVLKTSDGIKVHSFLAPIEVKHHNSTQVVFTGTDCSVAYQNKASLSSVKEQSEKQKYALKSFIKREVSFKQKYLRPPHIINAIYFANLSKTDLPNSANGVSRRNIFAGDSSFMDIVETIVNDNRDHMGRKKSDELRAFNSKIEVEIFSDPFRKVIRFSDMDRKKVENLTKRRLDKDTEYFKNLGNQLLIFRGRGGTGKTVKLLNLAYNVYKEGRRILLLTYNKALVMDIQRQFKHLGVGNSVGEPGFMVRSIFSFMHEWLTEFKKSVGEKKWADQKFLDEYEILKNDFLDYLKEGTISSDDIDQIKNNNFTSLFWDYVFIDEAQDWPANERDIIYKLYGYKNLVIADGVDQVNRHYEKINWREGVGSESQIVTLRSSLRLKINLCKATQLFAKKIGYNEWDLEPDIGLQAGRVVIILGNPLSQNAFGLGGFHRKFWKTVEEAKDKDSDIEPVDTLSIVPSFWVDKKKGLSRLGELYIENGRKVWDGSIDAERNDFPRDLEQFRIVQYASCRGLEGWMVVNYAIDEQYQQLLKHPHIDQTRKNDLLFSQEKSQLAEHYAKKSIMIPFTRAIDTMFVHVSDPNSFIGIALLTLHKEHPEIFQLKAIEENTATNRLEDLNKKPDFTKMGSFSVKVTEIKHNKGKNDYTRKQWSLLKAMYLDKFEIVGIRHKTANFFVSEGDEVLIEWITKTSSTPGYYTQRKLSFDTSPLKASPNSDVPF